jgi:clusterin-associated protein 1
MSFRELRIFTETMRMLGYERTISVESFRTPNVELVADILYWLIKRYEPAADVAYSIEREHDRVLFFRQVCDVAMSKARVKLNPKKLYQADGHAVQEMLKLASLLRDGVAASQADEEADYTALQAHVAQRNVNEAKTIRQLCSDLTADSSHLYFLLEGERQTRPQRERVLAHTTDPSDSEQRLKYLLLTAQSQVAGLQEQLKSLAEDDDNLGQKIETKKTQLERAQKRLKALMAVRPAFMEEYEKYEADLQQQFVQYLEQYRNLEYLENILSKFNKVEDELLAEQEGRLARMREKLRREELSALHDHVGADDSLDDPAYVAAQKAAALNAARADHSRSDLKRPRAASGRQRPGEANAAASSGYGGVAAGRGASGATASGAIMYHGEEDDDDDEDDSDDSDDSSSAAGSSDDSSGDSGASDSSSGGDSSDDSSDDDSDDSDGSDDSDDNFRRH